MRILNAKGKNFLSYLDFDYTYEAQGLTLIEGYDEDLDVNTGAGKSAFLDMISYGFFGATSKDLKADNVINWHVKKDLEHQLTFEDEAITYTIFRYRKSKKHQNDFYFTASDRPGEEIRGKDARETQRMIEEIIGFNHEIFTKSVYFGQFDPVAKFLSATDREKKELIGTICDLSAYDDMLDGVKENIKGNDEAAESLLRKSEPLTVRRETTMKQIEGVAHLSSNWSDKHIKDLEQVNSQIKTFDRMKEETLAGFAKEITDFEYSRESKLALLHEKMTEFELDKVKAITEAEKQEEAWSLDIKEQASDAESDFEKISTKVMELRSNYTRLKESDNSEEIRVKESEIKLQIQDLHKHEIKIGEINNQILILNSEQKKLREVITAEGHKLSTGEGECPHCHQEVSAEHLQKHIENLIQAGLSTKEKIGQLETQKLPEELGLAVREEKKEELVKMKIELDRCTKLEWELKNLESEGKVLNDSLEGKRRHIQSISEYKNPYQGKTEEIKSRPNRFLEDMERTKGEKCGAIYQLEQAEKQINPYPPRLKELEELVNPHLNQAEGILEEVNQLDAEIADLKQKEDLIRHQLSLGLFWKDALGVYIKSFLMDSFLDQLNSQANEYLETLFNGVLKIELSAVTEGKKGAKEKISQKIYNGNIECAYENLSGGERCRICLAVNLALSDITSKTLGKTFSILMLDEILTGLDTAGKSQTMKLLKELECRFETIFVIDHTEEFKSLFTNTIMVRKKSGTSTISKEIL